MLLGLIHEAWVSIAASRLRTALAMLGIVIGVGSVVLMLAVGAGSRRDVEESISKLGSNLLIVTAGSRDAKGLRSMDVSELTTKDADAIGQLPSVLASAAATSNRSFQVAFGKENWNSNIVGSVPAVFAIRNWSFSDGDSFTAEDARLGRRTAVIGATVVKKLYGEENPVNSTLRINGTPFRVTGVLQSKGQDFSGRDQDDVVVIPLSTAQRTLWGSSYVQGMVQTIFVQAASGDALDAATQEITELLRQRHKLRENAADDFTIRNLTSITQVATETTRALSLLLGAIASISLVVGGIGIMNIMLVTVTERTREIGIRKALGATQQHILIQFLMEAMMIAGVGSMIGLALGFAGGIGAEKWFQISVEYSLWSVVLALAVAAGVGILSGIYPAHKAAGMNPIEALRVAGA